LQAAIKPDTQKILTEQYWANPRKWSQPAFIGRRPASPRPPEIESQPLANRNQQHLEMQTQIVRE
jgi:hypothetical protein